MTLKKHMTVRTSLAAGLTVASLFPWLLTADAAAGDSGGQVAYKTPCQSRLGVTSAFDGVHRWYSCDASVTDLYRTDSEGAVTASCTIIGGLGALAYDAGRNGIWAGWTGEAGTVRFIALDANRNVVGSELVGKLSDAVVCGRNTGLAYDGLTDTLYFSDECSGTIHRYAVVPGSPPALGAHLADLLPSDRVTTVVRPEDSVLTSPHTKINEHQQAHSPLHGSNDD